MSRFKVVSLCFLWFLSSHLSAQVVSFQGVASDPETGSVLYIEKHRIELDESNQYSYGRVDYLSPSGEVFATKTLDYSEGITSPKLKFEDFRAGSALDVEQSLRETSITIESSDANVTDNILSLKIISSPPQTGVVDAGFDRLVVSNWPALEKGKKLTFPFLAITRARYFDFEVEMVKREGDQVTLKVQPANMFLKWFVDPIVLVYEAESKRLVSYEGITNIARFKANRETGDNYIAKIKYVYDS